MYGGEKPEAQHRLPGGCDLYLRGDGGPQFPVHRGTCFVCTLLSDCVRLELCGEVVEVFVFVFIVPKKQTSSTCVRML